MHSNEKGVTKPNHPKSVSKNASYARDLESLAEAKQIYNSWVQELRKVDQIKYKQETLQTVDKCIWIDWL
jgi:hypothetical protein